MELDQFEKALELSNDSAQEKVKKTKRVTKQYLMNFDSDIYDKIELIQSVTKDSIREVVENLVKQALELDENKEILSLGEKIQSMIKKGKK